MSVYQNTKVSGRNGFMIDGKILIPDLKRICSIFIESASCMVRNNLKISILSRIWDFCTS